MPRTREDLTNRKYNSLTGVEPLPDGKWKWRCDCGKEIVARSDNVKQGRTRSCGCAPPLPRGENITGNRYGRLTAIRYDTATKKWLFRCVCGNQYLAHRHNVKSGRITSCGCKKNGYYHDATEAKAHATPEALQEIKRAKAKGLAQRTTFDGYTIEEWSRILNVSQADVLRQIINFGKGEADAPTQTPEEAGPDV